jgi:hypothetical protein
MWSRRSFFRLAGALSASTFTLDRTISNLNNGNSCPSPRVVHEAMKRYYDISNQAPVYYRGQIERNMETIRRRLAAEFGVVRVNFQVPAKQDDLYRVPQL